MRVYVELALIENFCMDFTLLYCAKIVCKNSAPFWRVAAAAVFGACFAVAFPLFGLKGAAAVAVKIISGLAICAAAGKFKSFKAYFKMSAVFSAFTFALGGAMLAIFSFAGLSYESGAGYTVSSVPAGVPLFGALLLIIAARKIAARLKRADKSTVSCKIYAGGKCVEISGFFDSGNSVYAAGRPVSVIPLSAAKKIIDEGGIKERVKIHTVAGSKRLKMFTADKIEIRSGEKSETVKNVKIGISPRGCVAVLHPDLLEE